MKSKILYAIMRVGEDDGYFFNEYLCYDGANFYWSIHGTEKELIHINDDHFKILARWYWETDKGMTPLETWARPCKVSYNKRLIEISYGIEFIVFCGCRLYPRDTGAPLKIYEPHFNHSISDPDVHEWVQRFASNGE